MSSTKRENRKGKLRRSKAAQPVMSEAELRKLGGGHVAFIRTMTSDAAKAMFPAVEGLPSGVNIYCLLAADGTPIALTDSMQAAVGRAMGDELEIVPLQ